MKIRAMAKWDSASQRHYGIPPGKGLLLVMIEEPFRAKFGEELLRLNQVQSKRFDKAQKENPNAKKLDSLIDLEIDIQIYYKKRSTNANSLYWKLLEIEANWLNGNSHHRTGYWSGKTPEYVITPEEIHEEDLKTYCVKQEFYIKEADIPGFTRGIEFELGTVKSKTPVFDGVYRVEVWKTTSYMDSQEFSEWIHRITERLSSSGLLKTDESEFIFLKEQFKEILRNGQGTFRGH